MVRLEAEHEFRTKVYRTLLSDQGRLFSMELLLFLWSFGEDTQAIGSYFKLESIIWRKGFVG